MDVSDQPESRRPLSKTAAHAIGNVLIGLALGLTSYYLLTDLIAARQQVALRDEIDELGTMGAPSPDRLLEEPGGTGWETWHEEDAVYWGGLEAGGVFGRLVIEPIDLDVVVVRGHGTRELRKGPGWIDYTDLPGQTGNAGIAGHRTTYGAPFRRLDQLSRGDLIHLYSPFRRYTYEVTEVRIVTPDQVEVLNTTEEPQLTLSSCHPLHNSRYRLIVHAGLVEMRRLEQTLSQHTD